MIVFTMALFGILKLIKQTTKLISKTYELLLSLGSRSSSLFRLLRKSPKVSESTFFDICLSRNQSSYCNIHMVCSIKAYVIVHTMQKFPSTPPLFHLLGFCLSNPSLRPSLEIVEIEIQNIGANSKTKYRQSIPRVDDFNLKESHIILNRSYYLSFFMNFTLN